MLKHLKPNKKIHFIGIGGIGMSGIAEILNNMGFQVSGSDIKANSLTSYLEKIGIPIFIGHAKSNLKDDIDIVVYSNAIPKNNPEIEKATKLGISIIPRAEMLNEILTFKRAIGVAGTHGKTTTTAMISYILRQANLDPTMIIGGILSKLQNNAHLGEGDYVVYEACEAFGSINYLNGEIVCITNIDDDHMEYYLHMDNLLKSFLDYMNRIPIDGVAIINGDDPYIKELIPRIKKPYLLFGFDSSNHIYPTDIKTKGFSSHFNVTYKNKLIKNLEIQVPGQHNIYNALVAIAVSLYIGIAEDDIRKGLLEFTTPGRRFQLYGTYQDAYIVDDYAHHPTEIAATIKTALQLVKDSKELKQVIVAFQPHLYTRTSLHYEKFAKELEKADFILLAPIYEGREEAMKDVNSKLISDIFDKDGYKKYKSFQNLGEIYQYAKSTLKKGDIFITMGAGDINEVASLLIQE